MSSLATWVQQIEADDFWTTAVILMVLCVAGFIGAFYFFSRKRIMENTPTSRIRSAAQGYVELDGRCELLAGPEIHAPLTGSLCTWYSYQIEEYRHHGKKSHWVTIEHGDSDELFRLIDDTGDCIVDPEGAAVTPAISDTWYGNSRRPTSGPGSTRGRYTFGGGRYRYTEKRMHPGERLYAIGLFKTIGGAGTEYDAEADVRELLRQWKQNSQALLKIYDKNRDGELDMEEWQAVREKALAIVMKEHAENSNAPPVNMLSRTNDKRRPYMLSTILQETLIKRYHSYAIGLLALFFISGTAATWMINVRLP